MNREIIIQKTLLKLSSQRNKIPDNELNSYIEEFKNILIRVKREDINTPKNFLKVFGDIVDKNNYKKEEIQQILSKAKQLGIIKKSINSNRHMEKAWRSILKIYGLTGFSLEN